MTEITFDNKMTMAQRNEHGKAFFIQAFGGKAYVRLNGSARDGTIAIADFSQTGLYSREKFAEIRNSPTFAASTPSVGRTLREQLRDYYSWEAYIGDRTYSVTSFSLRFDGSDKLITPASFDWDKITFTWLKDYEGPTSKVFKKAEPKEKVTINAVDKLGGVVQVGDFITTVKRNTLYVGTVESITESGKSVYLRPLRGGEIFMVSAGSNIVIIDDMTKKRAILKKLSSK